MKDKNAASATRLAGHPDVWIRDSLARGSLTVTQTFHTLRKIFLHLFPLYMTDDKQDIFDRLSSLHADCIPPLKGSASGLTRCSVSGAKKITIGKKVIDGMYFSSVVIQKHYVSFYFFPIYTHPKEFTDLPETLSKCLKGKSCFHFRQLDAALERSIRALLKKGLRIYRKEKWV